MPPSLLETFRTLSSFSPSKVNLRGAPWEEYVDWAISQGLAPLAAYNLEYRLAGGGAPEWVRDRLLSVYQGSLSDNVMKMVHFKRTVDELEGRRIVLLSGASYADSLYPHVAFRPVLEVSLLLRKMDVEPFANFLGHAEFKPDPSIKDGGTAMVLSDGRTPLFLFSKLLGPAFAKEESGMFERALPVKVYGPSFFRLDLEDAILVTCLEHASAGYDVPYLSFVDLRELLLGAPDLGSVYNRPFDVAALHARAKAWKLERALYASTAIVAALFPWAKEQAERAAPPLRAGTRALLNRTLIHPLSAPGRVKEVRGGSRLRQLLTGR